jgi:hypothetical protein
LSPPLLCTVRARPLGGRGSSTWWGRRRMAEPLDSSGSRGFRGRRHPPGLLQEPRCRPFYAIRRREKDGGDIPSRPVGSLIPSPPHSISGTGQQPRRRSIHPASSSARGDGTAPPVCPDRGGRKCARSLSLRRGPALVRGVCAAAWVPHTHTLPVPCLSARPRSSNSDNTQGTRLERAFS